MIYLCTTGTSAAKLWKPASLDDKRRFNESIVNEMGGVQSAAKQLLETFVQYRIDNDEHLQSKLSAEIHSLARMQLQPDDRVVLFASETLDGQACAYALAEYLEQHGHTVDVEVVKGLQTTDARLFRQTGVVEFIKKTAKYIDDYGVENCTLNPTGGFKALVPYAVLLGMIRRVSCRYIFEFSSQLIELPPLPVDFARSKLQSLKEALELIERETFLPEKEFNDCLTWDERQEYRVLFEWEGKEVTLSAIGMLMLEVLQQPSDLTIFISQEAMKGLSKLRERADVDPIRYLTRIGKDRVKLNEDLHGNAGEGVSWLKPGNTTDRYLVSVEDEWKLLIWEMHEHEEYDQRSKLSNLGKTVKAQRKQKYAPFFRMDIVD